MTINHDAALDYIAESGYTSIEIEQAQEQIETTDAWIREALSEATPLLEHMHRGEYDEAEEHAKLIAVNADSLARPAASMVIQRLLVSLATILRDEAQR